MTLGQANCDGLDGAQSDNDVFCSHAGRRLLCALADMTSGSKTPSPKAGFGFLVLPHPAFQIPCVIRDKTANDSYLPT